ncbi:hypothetical protein LCGC14_2143470 [marine sediment metagenome]|uniref:Uncharacterized protein n=2 Tax=marine sediment metagenome TaxID=412755 RepID=A0A0F9EJX5_9ZZZZ
MIPMSEKIISFPGKTKGKADEDRIWICECGCQTHYVHEDGRIECAICCEITTEGNWQTGAEVEPIIDQVLHDRTIVSAGDDNFMFRRFAQEVIKPDVIAAALFRESGSQRTTFRNEDLPKNESERRWFRRRARQMLVALGADWKR